MASHGVPRTAIVDKSEAAKARERKQIDEYLKLEQDVRDRIQKKDFSNATFFLTSSLLKQNPEYYTIWNNRRQILHHVISKQSNQPDINDDQATAADRAEAEKSGLTLPQREISLIIKEDLQFLVPLLRQFPKCYWIWNHRSWLLGEATAHLPAATAIEYWTGELGLVTKMLGLDSRNFHGWDYRRTTVASLERLTGASMVKSEFDYTTKMIKSNLSNFSAWHNRTQLIPRMLREDDADNATRKKIFDDEFELITTALYTDPYDQSLWFYHQALMSTLDSDAPTNNPSYGRDTTILKDVDLPSRMHYLEQELDSVQEMLDGAEDCKYIYQALIDYSIRYLSLGGSGLRVSQQAIRDWLDKLKELDPLRSGRWHDMEKKLVL